MIRIRTVAIGWRYKRAEPDYHITGDVGEPARHDAQRHEDLQPAALADHAVAGRRRTRRAARHPACVDCKPVCVDPRLRGRRYQHRAGAAVIAARLPRAPFIIWFLLEIVVCAARVIVLVASRRAAAAGKPTPTDAYVLLGLCWAFSVGYGAFISLVSGDWVAATLACVSSAAMVGGTCFRNFGAPRMSAAMIVLSLGPVALGAIFALYLVVMSMAGYRLNANLVATMRAEQENERRAQHDALTGLLNRVGLANAIDAKSSARRQQELALFYLDLDGFKAVNDTHGHALGDRLLQKVAERLQGLIRAGDLAARIGGDEFVVLSEMSDRSKILCFGEELIEKLAAPHELADENVHRNQRQHRVALAPRPWPRSDEPPGRRRRGALRRQGEGKIALLNR